MSFVEVLSFEYNTMFFKLSPDELSCHRKHELVSYCIYNPYWPYGIKCVQIFLFNVTVVLDHVFKQ